MESVIAVNECMLVRVQEIFDQCQFMTFQSTMTGLHNVVIIMLPPCSQTRLAHKAKVKATMAVSFINRQMIQSTKDRLSSERLQIMQMCTSGHKLRG